MFTCKAGVLAGQQTSHWVSIKGQSGAHRGTVAMPVPLSLGGDTGSHHHTGALYLEKLREEIWRGGSGSSFCPQPGGDEADSRSR